MGGDRCCGGRWRAPWTYHTCRSKRSRPHIHPYNEPLGRRDGDALTRLDGDDRVPGDRYTARDSHCRIEACKCCDGADIGLHADHATVRASRSGGFFLGVGTVPGIIATIFFAMPLPIRLTAHGLRMVEPEVVEAGEAFGANRLTILFLVKLPLAFRSIMAGVNQCIMMSLSMVIIASMIGAGGLGDEIIRSISRLQVGRGVEAGLAVVVLAILIDRFSKRISQKVDPTA